MNKLNTKMKKNLLQLTVGCALALAMAPTVQAQLIADDAFLTGGSNYTPGAITGQNPTVTGFTGAWAQYATGNDGSVSATPLSYSGTTGYVTTSGAGAMSDPISNSRTARAFDPSVSNAFAATSGTVYMSFELQLSSAAANAPYQAVELNSNPANDPTRFMQLGFAGTSTTDFASSTNFGVSLNSGAVKGTLGVADTNAHLFVIQLNLTAGTDTMNVWQDPTDITGATPTGGTEASLSGFTVANVPAFLDLANFVGNGTGGTELGEFRIGDTLADIADVPEVPTSSLTLLGLGALVIVMVRRKMIA
jgi:hypothetical protein